VVLGALFGATLAATCAAAPPSKAKIQELDAEIQAHQAAIGEAEQQRKKVLADLDAQDRQVADLRRQQRLKSEELTALRSDLRATKERLQTLERDQAKLIDEMRAALRLGQRMGEGGLLRLWLSGESPAETRAWLHGIGRLTAAQKEKVAVIETQAEAIRIVREQVAAREQRVAEAVQHLETQSRELEHASVNLRKLLDRLKRDASIRREAVTSLKNQRAGLQKELDRLARSQGALNIPPGAFAKLKGKLIWPVQGKVVEDRESLLEGLYVEAATGSEVRAVADGKVLFADWVSGFGLLLLLDHGDGYYSLYAHQQDLLVEKGVPVHAGDVIGRVGRTGSLGPPRLYFELRHNQKAIDPRSWCRSAS